MKIDAFSGKTLRSTPSGLSAPMGLAARAGLVRPWARGWLMLPLGVKVLDRLCEAVREGLDCQPVGMVNGKAEGVCEALTGLLRSEIQSYRQLPLRIATRASGPRPSVPGAAANEVTTELLLIAGAFAGSEALSSYLDRGAANLQRLGRLAHLEGVVAEGIGSTTGWAVPDAEGPDVLVVCPACGAVHLRQAAPFARSPVGEGEGSPLQRAHTPGASTIQTLAEQLGVGREKTLKALVLATESGEVILAVVRGDLEASMEKVVHVLGCQSLRPATEEEITAVGAVPGFAGPIGLRVRGGGEIDGLRVLADLSVYTGADFAAGANEPDYHYIHVDPRRDLPVTDVADIALAPAGARCVACGSALVERAARLLAWRRTVAGPQFSDESGETSVGAAGCLTVDVLGLFEALVRCCADEAGIAWPAQVAPALVHVISLRSDEACLPIVRALEGRGIDVLLDDRPLGAGIKFADADLIGCPLRVTVSERSLKAGGVEVAGRRGESPVIVAPADVFPTLHKRLTTLMSS